MAGDMPLLAIVDDDADVRIALVRLVSSAGCAVDSFATGAEFLMSIEHRVPDCVVLDLHMPGMSGFEVQSALARANPGLPVVVITGHETVESRNRALALGARAYLAKPVDHDALLAAIEDATRHRPGARA
jgi:FixJ family two-component response regulator